MITVNVRKQGGAAIITIPSDILRILNIKIGAKLELDVSKEGFTAYPRRKNARKDVSRVQLLQEQMPKDRQALNAYLSAPRSESSSIAVNELNKLFADIPKLSPEERSAFEKDLKQIRSEMKVGKNPWD